MDLRGRRAAALGLAPRAWPASGSGRARGSRSPPSATPSRTDALRPPRARASSTRCATTSRCGDAHDPGRGLGRAPRPGDARGHGVDAAAARRPVLARRHRRPPQRRPPRGLRALGAPARPRARGPRLAPAPGRAAVQLVRRPRRRRARHQGLRRARAGSSRRPSRRSTPRRCCRWPRRCALPEPSIARLSSDGESVIAVGTTRLFRIRLDRDAGRLELDDAWQPAPTGPSPDRSYGWDPVLTGEHVLWLDQGRNRTDRTMLGSGEAGRAGAALVGAPATTGPSARPRSAGCRTGPVSNPPAWDPDSRTVVAYDSGNGVIGAWRLAATSCGAALAPRRHRPRRPPDRLSGHP